MGVGLSDGTVRHFAEAGRILIEGYRRMTSTQKLPCVESLNGALVLLRMRLGALRLGRETMINVFGWDPDEKGW